jgi:hypothetical protein
MWGLVEVNVAGRLTHATVSAGGLRGAARRVLSALVCGTSFWGLVSGVTVSLTIDARQPVFAQPTKEQRLENRKYDFETAKFDFKKSREATRDFCEAKTEEARAAAAKEVQLYNERIEYDMDGIIYNSDDLTEEERNSIESQIKALDERVKPDASAADKKAADKKYEDALQQFRDLTRERRKAILEKLESGKEIEECPVRPTDQTIGFGAPATVTLSAGYEGFSDWTTFKSEFDTLKTRGFANAFQIAGQANWGAAWLSGQLALGGGALGSFNDEPTGFPGAGTSGALNSGALYGVDLKAGYSLWQSQQQRAGVEAGYYLLSNTTGGTITSIGGMPIGGLGVMTVNNDLWQAAQGGVFYQTVFPAGGRNFTLRGNVDGMFVNLRSGMLDANGGGVESDVKLSTPLYGPLSGFLQFQYTYMNVAGDIAGLHMNATDNNLAVAAGITWSDGINFGTGLRY